MRVLAGCLITPVLVLLLVSTTPVGTGVGLHQLDLIHPLFSHVHVVNGQVLTHEQVEQQPAASTPGPALGAGGGPGSADAGIGLSPTTTSALCDQPGMVLVPCMSWITMQANLPHGRLESPPDPPPPQ